MIHHGNRREKNVVLRHPAGVIVLLRAVGEYEHKKRSGKGERIAARVTVQV